MGDTIASEAVQDVAKSSWGTLMSKPK
ncbi:uncharacterized protein G2W53_009614 [Senna tora]|uniref:Uncharacterized protein n=1 Tax=Senna tora TaxID=362788 RepID=A0A834WXU0_9FABA|nr:uncharacterized protein G2W53_009614 [Senna tora]